MLFSRTLSTIFIDLKDPQFKNFLYRLAPRLFSHLLAYLFYQTYFDKVSSSPPLQLDYPNFKIYFNNSSCHLCFYRLDNIYNFCMTKGLSTMLALVTLSQLFSSFMIFFTCSFQIIFLSITEKPTFFFYLFMHRPPSMSGRQIPPRNPDRKLDVKFLNWMPNRNEICKNGMKSFHFDVQPRPVIRQTLFQAGVISTMQIKCSSQGSSSKSFEGPPSFG